MFFDMSKDNGGDGLGGAGAASRGAETSVLDALRAVVKDNVTPATLLTEAEMKRRRTAVYRLFDAKGQTEQMKVDAALVIYFAVQGTSPETPWVNAPPIVVGGRSVAAADVVREIGPEIKKYMGRFSSMAIAAYHEFPELYNALSERIARANLSRTEGYLVIDYLGKDGVSLDAASLQRRNVAKTHLIAARNDQRSVTSKDITSGYAQQRVVGERHNVAPDPFA